MMRSSLTRYPCAFGHNGASLLGRGPSTLYLSGALNLAQNRLKGTVPQGSDRKPTKKVKTKRKCIQQQRDKKLAALRDVKHDSAEQEVKPKKKSLLEAAGIKLRKELKKKKAPSTLAEGERQSRFGKPKIKPLSKAESDVEIVVGPEQVAAEPLMEDEEDEQQNEETRDYLIQGEAGYEQLPPAMDLETVIQKLNDERAENMVVVDVREKCNFASYMIIVEGRSGRHIRGMGDMLVGQLKQRQRALHLQAAVATIAESNRNNNDWLSVDTGAAMVHIFSAGARRYYDLDELWITKGTMREQALEATRKGRVEDLDPLPDLNDVPGGWNPFDMAPGPKH